MLLFMFLCVICCVNAGPTQMSLSEDQILEDVNYKTTLLGIEEKLKSIENTLSMQYAITINGKIDYYGRKIDNIEKQLSRFQIQMRMELEKISENISTKNYKDDVTRDRVTRKIDVIYERINHKLGNVEGEIDLSIVKAQNGRDLIVSKLDKIEESLTIRDSDMEAELADAVAAIDDLKSNCNNIEDSIRNVTKETAKMYLKNNEKLIKRYHNQTMAMLEKTNKTLHEGFEKIEQREHVLLHNVNNNSNFMLEAKDEYDENMNEYANKIINMYTDISTKNTLLDNKIDELGKIANASKIEQQNALRALTVQVGRKLGKQSENESLIENHPLGEMAKNIEEKFDNIMLAQNLFHESCHRVQMDEAQLESQISIVLDKLIDIFENKTSVGPKDIHQLEHLIRTHDSNIRRNIHHVTDNLLSLTQQMSTGNEEHTSAFKSQKSQLDALDLMMQDLLISGDDSKLMQAILEIVQNFQKQLSVTHQEMLNALIQVNKNSYKKANTSEVDSNMLQSVVDDIKNIFAILGSIEIKINKSYLDYYSNRYNVDLIAQRFGTKLIEYLKHLQADNQTTSNGFSLTEAIFEAFGNNPNTSQQVGSNNGYPYMINSENIANSTIAELMSEIFGNSSNSPANETSLLCFDATTNTTCQNPNKVGESKNVNHNETVDTNCLPYYVDLIDVRANLDVSKKTNCSILNSTNKIKNEETRMNNSTATQRNCTPNYVDLIDVRYDPNPDCNLSSSENSSSTTQGDIRLQNLTQQHNQADNCSGDLIDVRSGNGNAKICNNTNDQQQDALDGEQNVFKNNIFLNGPKLELFNKPNSDIKSLHPKTVNRVDVEAEALKRNVFLPKPTTLTNLQPTDRSTMTYKAPDKTATSTEASNLQLHKNVFRNKTLNTTTEDSLNRN